MIDNANLLQSNARGASGLSYRFEAAANPQVIPPEEYRKLIRGLNSKQRAMIMFHRDWCKKAVHALKHGQQINDTKCS